MGDRVYDNEGIVKLDFVHDPAFVAAFLEDVGDRLVNLRLALKTLVSTEVFNQKPIVDAMYRDLHTIKGTSSSFGFSTLARLAGNAEDFLDTAKKTWPRVDGKAGSSFSDILQEIQISRDEINSACKSLKERGGAPKLPLDRLVDKYRYMLEKISRELGKRMKIITLPAGQEISTGLFETLSEPLVHILRNAADHGIEFEATRLLAGKPSYGSIDLKWVESEHEIELTVADDGTGIDCQKLSEKALLKGLITYLDLAGMSEKEKLELIFFPGLSSRDLATDISGKGVGMDAVACWAKRVGATIRISSERGKGTQITLKIPNFPSPNLGK